MPKDFPEKQEDGTVLLSEEQFAKYEGIEGLEKQVAELTQKLEAAQADIKKLETPDPRDEMPEEFRVLLEKRDQEVAAMQRRLLSAEVRAVVADAQAFRDTSGRAHSPMFLEWMENVLQGNPVGDAEKPIKLEAGGSEKYFFEAVVWLSKNIPGQVPMDGVTDGDEHRLEGSTSKYTQDDFREFWGKPAGGE